MPGSEVDEISEGVYIVGVVSKVNFEICESKLALVKCFIGSLASQQGEIEADMALSKWFLCGAEGSFEKDEGLAFTFAEKAARKGLPSAEFAMGYYSEVGIGGPKDLESARKWYTKVSCPLHAFR